MAVGGPSWPNLQCLVRRKPATAGWAEDADRGGVQRLAKTLSIPHLVAIGTFFLWHAVSGAGEGFCAFTESTSTTALSDLDNAIRASLEHA
jgi:hypothetical protein